MKENSVLEQIIITGWHSTIADWNTQKIEKLKRLY